MVMISLDLGNNTLDNRWI